VQGRLMPVVIRGGREVVRLLIVEDELPLAEVMAAGLEASGYHVWHTGDGAIPARLAAYSVLAKPFTLAKLVLFIERTATPQ